MNLNRKLKILVSNPNFKFGVGGRDDYFIPILNELTSEGHEIYLSCDSIVDSALLPSKGVFVRKSKPPINNVFWRLNIFSKILNLYFEFRKLKSLKIDVFLTCGLIDVIAANYAMKKIPIVFIPNSLLADEDVTSYLKLNKIDYYYLSFIMRRIQKIGLKNSKKILIFTKTAFEIWKSRYSLAFQKCCIAPPGCNTIKYAPRVADSNLLNELGLKKEHYILLAAGRLVPLKAYEFLLHAMALTNDNTYLLVAGDGPDHDSLVGLAVSLRVEDRVRFLGFRTDLDKLLNLSHIFIHPSRLEYYGLVMAQALCSGVPVICRKPNRGSVDTVNNELVSDGVTGFLVKSEKELSEKINLLIEDKELLEEMKVNARQVALKRYSWGRHFNQLKNLLYDSIQ